MKSIPHTMIEFNNKRPPRSKFPSTFGWGTFLLNMDEDRAKLIRLLLARLERISADSFWAHRASGIRGALIRVMEQMEANQIVNAADSLNLTKQGFDILDKTAREKIRKGMR